jgi:hypothetical protein
VIQTPSRRSRNRHGPSASSDRLKERKLEIGRVLVGRVRDNLGARVRQRVAHAVVEGVEIADKNVRRHIRVATERTSRVSRNYEVVAWGQFR